MSTAFRALFDGDTEVMHLLSSLDVDSVMKFAQMEKDALESLPLAQKKKKVLKNLHQCVKTPVWFLPGDVIKVETFTCECTTLETVHKDMETILQLQDEGQSRYKVMHILKSGVFEISGECSSKVVFYFHLKLQEAGQLYSNLSEMGFADRKEISQALLSLNLKSFDSGLDSPDGMRLIDRLTNSTKCESSPQGDLELPLNDEYGETKTDQKASLKVEGYTMLGAVLKCLRAKRTFPTGFKMLVSESMNSSAEVEAKWTWGSHEPADMSLTDDNLRVTKNYVNSPDYSCAIGSEALEAGLHTWEISVENTKQTSFSMWLGIARGVEERNGLGQYPSSESCDYLIAFGCGSSDVRLVSHGVEPNVECISGHQYNAGQTIKFELDTEERTLQMSVDGELVVIVRNVEPEGNRPFVCMDYSESAMILSKTFVRSSGASSVDAASVNAVSADEVAVAFDNSLWTEEMDAAALRLTASGMTRVLFCKNRHV
jgi:hypothetical protein